MANARHSKAGRFVQQRLFSGLSAFVELERRIADLPDEKSRGDAFEVFTEAYLATQRKHDAETVWPLPSVPTEILGNLQLATQDYGVDGVLKTRLGKFSAYQVKFRTDRPALTWRELSTFMALADSPNIHSRILLTNCDDLPSVLNDRQGFFCIRGSDLDRLEPGDFKTIEAWLADSVYQAPKKTPQPHQAEALDKILPAFREYDRVSAIMACGTGKTLVALWVAEKMQVSRVLVLVPSLALLRQTLHEWLRETNLPALAYLCVCSDPTVKEGLDTIDTKQSDLDFQVSTDAASVREFLDAPFNGAKIVFSTYQSAQVVGAALKPGEAFDLAVFDEAHKTAGREGRNYAFALEDANLPIRKRLFLTATPRHFDIRHRDKDGEFKVQSMDDTAVYGPRAYTLSFAAAAKKGIICRYKVIISLINKQMVSDFARQHGVTLVERDEISARWVANLIALKQAVEKSGAGKIITFHSRVKIAEKYAAVGPRGIASQLDGYDVRHVNGAQSTMERSRIISDFADAPKSVLTNARCLTEGVDIPAVDMVAFIDPRQSRVDIAQAVGRAMRKPRGQTTKTVGYVVVPLFAGIGERDSLEETLHSEKFDVVADVLNALQEHDEELVEIIREIKERKGRGESFDPRRLNEKVQVIGPLVELDRLSASIVVEIGDRIGDGWDEWFGVLQQYIARERHCRVPKGHLEGIKRLGSWVSNQRLQQDNIPAERRQRLERLGFEWDPFAADWKRGIDSLEQFKARERHCRVPARHVEGTYRLGQWVSHQRKQRDSMAVERRQRLEALGFEWDQLAVDWEEGFAALEQFKARECHCWVPQRHIEGTYNLGQWVATQRKQGDNMPVGRRQRLDALGFIWDTLVAAWEEGFAALQKFHARERHCRVPGNYIEGTFRLGQWVSERRKQKNSMPVERRQRLEALGFEWDPFAVDWEEGFAALERFKVRERHCQVPAKHLEGTYRLGQWVSNQRRHRDSMSVERQQRLEVLGFEWDILASAWEEAFAALERFYAREHHCLVSTKHVEGAYRLGQWVSVQRKTRQGLPIERRQRLEALGFAWDAPAAWWEEGFAVLTRFRVREGHCRVPKRHLEGVYELGQWVSVQRKLSANMPVERRQRLEALGFDWDPVAIFWKDGFAALERFTAREGHCRVPKRHLEGTFRLGQWVGHQRSQKNSMPVERRQRLDALGFVWRVG